MLSYLPIVDCLPFKKGNNISDKMKMPADAIPDSTVITFVYKKDGKEIEFTADKFPPDFNATTYQFVRRSDKLIRKGKNNEPEIKGFVLTTENNDDSTEAILKDPDYKVLVFTPGFESVHPAWINRFSTFYDKLKERNIRLYIVTSDYDNANLWASKRNISKEITIFKCDFTIIKIAARTNPCFYLVKQGTIINKWSYKRISDAEKQVSKIPVQPATSNQ
jgi:hypothetical protein